jgi:GNAT superfamily N-acetyltransferase
MADYTIRPARLDDIPAMAELLSELFAVEADFEIDKTTQEAGLELLLADDSARQAFVAEMGGCIVGMCSGQLVVSTAEGRLSAWIEDVVVSRVARGGGVGRALVENVLEWAANQGATRCQLLADRTNTAALEFYKHVGWSNTNLICLRRKL